MQTSFSKNRLIYAGFFSRLAAFITDSILVAIALLIVKVPIWFVKIAAGDIFLFKPFLFQFTVVDAFYYLLTLAYFVLFTYYSGATIGKHLMKLKVVNSEGKKLTFISVLIRESVGRYLSAFVVYIGYIMAGVDSRKQGLHDKIADTCVVYKHGLGNVEEENVQPVPAMVPAQQTQPVPPVQPIASVQQVHPTSPAQSGRFSQSLPPMQENQEL